MVMCFVPDCNHYNQRDSCRFFRIPCDEKLRKMWIKNIRREDRLPTKHSQVCSCHFKDGIKANGPSIFKRNEKKVMMFESPEKRQKNSETNIEEGTSNSETANVQCCASLRYELYQLKNENEELKKEVERLKKAPFSYARIKHDATLVAYFTGLPSAKVFDTLLQICTKAEITYYAGWVVENPPKEDQLLISLMKLKLNPGHVDLSVRFSLSRTTISNIFVTWLNVLHEIIFLNLMNQVPTLNKNQSCLPHCFNHFVNCRVAVDCTEIVTDVPKRLDHQKLFYSSYKARNTMKVMIAVVPNGVITYVSALYPGSNSGKEVFKTCSMLYNCLEPGDLILADKGFLISDLIPAGVYVNVPPFLYSNQFTPSEVIETTNIAKARIHVERAIRRIKVFKIVQKVPKKFFPYATQIFQVCAALTNFQNPLLKEVKTAYFE